MMTDPIADLLTRMRNALRNHADSCTINLDKVEFVQGMDITFVTTASTDEEGLALLRLLGMPFQKPE